MLSFANENLHRLLYRVDAFFTTYIFLQIKVGESEDKEVEVDRFASLTIMHAEAEMVNVYTMLGTKVTFHATGPTDDVTVVWDYALDRHVGWRLEGISDVCEVSPLEFALLAAITETSQIGFRQRRPCLLY